MKLVSYCAPEEHLNDFDSVFNKLEIWADKFNINDISDLSTFIIRLPTIRDCSNLILDLRDGKDIEKLQVENIKTAINRLATFTACKPVVLFSKEDPTATVLAGKLTEAGVRNIVYDGENTAVELEACLTGAGKSFSESIDTINNSLQQIAINNTQVNLTIPAGKLVQIAVAGTKQCIGATTNAISIAAYLKKIGLSPIVVTFDENFYQKVTIAFDVKENLYNAININNIDIARRADGRVKDNYNAVIYDFGTLRSSEVGAWSKADISILISSSRAWDLADLDSTENIINGKKHKLWFPFADGEEMAAYKEWDKLAAAELAALPVITNPFAPHEFIFYHSNLLPALKEIAGQK